MGCQSSKAVKPEAPTVKNLSVKPEASTVKNLSVKPEASTVKNLKDVEKKRYKKKSLPAPLKRQVWNVYVGAEKGKTKCFCCNYADIFQCDFHCGHVRAEVNGGGPWVPNLRPICAKCNLSMGEEDMDVFQKRYFPDSLPIPRFTMRSDGCPPGT